MSSATTARIDARFRARIGQGALLWCLLGAGLLIRLIFLSTTTGNRFDLGSLQLVANLLVSHPSHVYEVANVPGQTPRWPYPPGYFPVVLVVKEFADATGLGFERLIRIPASLADLGIAWVINDFLGSRGIALRARLAGVALVALGPSFIAISGVHGQIDAVAILPAVIALSVWERDRSEQRAWRAGLLVGLGAAIKIVPGLVVLALLPTSRSRKEVVTLVGAALAVPAVASLAGVAISGTHWISGVANYHGGVGLGGIGLLAQPDLPLNWLHLRSSPPNVLTRWFIAHGGLIAAGSILVSAGVLMRFRTRAPIAAVVIWLTVYVFGISFFLQYMVWGLPFFLMAGYIAPVLFLELLMLPAILVIYVGTTQPWVVSTFYSAPILAVWLVLAVALASVARPLRRAADLRRVDPVLTADSDG